MPLREDVSRNLTWLAVAAVAATLLYFLGPVLTPFLLAGILAYICQPLVLRLGKKRVPRTLAVVLVMLLQVLAATLLLLTVLPMFIKEVSRAAAQLPDFLDRMNATLAPWLTQKTGFAVRLDAGSVKQWLAEMAQTADGLGVTVLNSLRLGGLGLIGLLANAVLVPVVQFYVMRDWETMQHLVRTLIPPGWRERVIGFASEADEALGQYLHGQVLVILVMCTFYTLGLWLSGLELFLPIGIVTGILVFVPYLGAIVGLFLATFAAVMQFPDWTGIVWVWVVFALGQTLEGNVVVPKLVGERIGLHPLAVIFAMLAFGEIFGFFGLLMALPASAVLLVALRKLKTRYLASDLYGDHRDHRDHRDHKGHDKGGPV